MADEVTAAVTSASPGARRNTSAPPGHAAASIDGADATMRVPVNRSGAGTTALRIVKRGRHSTGGAAVDGHRARKRLVGQSQPAEHDRFAECRRPRTRRDDASQIAAGPNRCALVRRRTLHLEAAELSIQRQAIGAEHGLPPDERGFAELHGPLTTEAPQRRIEIRILANEQVSLLEPQFQQRFKPMWAHA